MFGNNPFLKKDPLVEAVRQAQADGDLRRAATAIVNEEFGVYSRNAVVREELAAYDAALEEAYKALKEGNRENKEKKKEHEEKTGMEHIKKMGGFPGQSLKRTARELAKEGLDPVGKEDKDIDNDGDHDKSDKYLLHRRAVRSRAIKEGSAYAGKNPFAPNDPSVQGSGDVTSSPEPKHVRPSNPERIKNLKDPRDPSVQGSGDVTMKEENLDEISKNLAGRYIKKAHYDGGMTDFKHGKEYGKSLAKKTKTSPWSKELSAKSQKRERGIETAVNKLTGKAKVAANEETNLHESLRALVEERKRTAAVSDAFLAGQKAKQKTLQSHGTHVTYHGNTIAKHVGDEVHVTAAGYGTSPSTRGHMNGILSRLGSDKVHQKKGKLMHGDKEIGSDDWIKVKKPVKATFGEGVTISSAGYGKVKLKRGGKTEKTVKDPRDAMMLVAKKKTVKEDSSFNAAQETGKSVNEVAMGMPPAITPPSVVGQRMPGILKRGGTATGKFVNPQRASASTQRPASRALVPSGNRMPTAGASNLPARQGASGVVNATQSASKGGSGFTYSRGPTTPGVQPPHPSEKIGGFGNFKAAGAKSAVRGIVAKAAGRALGVAGLAVPDSTKTEPGNPIFRKNDAGKVQVAGYRSATEPRAGKSDVNTTSRMVGDMSRRSGMAPSVRNQELPDKIAPVTTKAPGTLSAPVTAKAKAAPVTAPKETPNTNKSGYFKGGPVSNYTVKKGETLSGIAKSTNQSVSDLVKMNKIGNPDKIATGAKLMTSVPKPPSRPADISSAPISNAPKSEPAKQPDTTTAKVSVDNNRVKSMGYLGSADQSVSDMKTKPFAAGVDAAKATQDNMSPTPMTPPEEKKKASLKEEVQIGDNKYRIV